MMAATPPTRMSSTSWRAKTVRISTNLGAESIPEHDNAIGKALSHLDSLGRCEAEHPEDDVIVIPFSQRWIQRLAVSERGILLRGATDIGQTVHGSMLTGAYPPHSISSSSVPRTSGRSSGRQAWKPGLLKRA